MELRSNWEHDQIPSEYYKLMWGAIDVYECGEPFGATSHGGLYDY